MAFTFIDNSAIDRSARRLIRSRAAEGKNLGKGRPRKTPRRSETAATAGYQIPTREKERPQPHAVDQVARLERPYSDTFSSVAFPYELTPRLRSLLHKVFSFIIAKPYPVGLVDAIAVDQSKSLWVPLVFTDEAFFHCTVATLGIVHGPHIIGSEGSAETANHLARTFRLVNNKLSGPQATSNTTLAAVIALTQYERLRSQHRQGLIHLHGLRRIVEMRGGIGKLIQESPGISQKIFRADLEFALNLGTPTMFSHTDLPSYDAIELMGSPLADMTQVASTHPLFAQLDTDVLRVSQ
ncbi:hypothetical protein JX265_010002 [Neoarthrinium moseri]|uniref:Uncharacterized protein n=1 Tax=Neoarthrinium moseri TaxID=1658444 RepID=A0A9P9WEZ6_9PEZI|nr:uncharacterized protein JN550_012030 [Neoarthrinium moseri]KAI1844503.1 hypothetical protein JX266_009390 [Neoarthrinium moseri]KAI1859512.1 hypothetical protein JN550_012030 [Neoarthrinium moseri]KAI1860078.1 hypothetical protein JX265_010002 [Neoarthrinium moseri]